MGDTLLVINSSSDLEAQLVEALQPLGFQLSFARSMTLVLAMLQRQRPQLFIVNASFPSLVQTFRTLRDLAPGTPILLLSPDGHTLTNIIPDAVMPLAFDNERLIRLINELIWPDEFAAPDMDDMYGGAAGEEMKLDDILSSDSEDEELEQSSGPGPYRGYPRQQEGSSKGAPPYQGVEPSPPASEPAASEIPPVIPPPAIQPSRPVPPPAPPPRPSTTLPPPQPAPRPTAPITKPAEPSPDQPVPGSAATDGGVRFSAYYPREMPPNEWQTMLAYVFRESSAGAIAADARTVLGDRLAAFRNPSESARQLVPEGALVTATPQLEGFQFNPPTVSIGFYEAWHRLDFKVRAHTAPLDASVNGRITFSVEGLIVADLPISIYVGTQGTVSTPANVTASPYPAVFASYSRQDKAVVERVERAYKALGLEYLRDLITIRSGEDWNNALKRMIEQANIFQLFWSSHSATSEFVEQEWKYALQFESQRPAFIRPVYWEQPMPPVPDELGKLNFAYQPELDD